MPYFVFKIAPQRQLDLVCTFETYREARQRVRDMRVAIDHPPQYTVRMVHAADPAEAQRLLRQHREPRPLGEEA